MTDVFDRATEVEQLLRDAALAHQREAARAGMHPGAAVADCDDCGDPIPVERRSAVPGCTKCIECERIAEEQRKRMKR